MTIKEEEEEEKLLSFS